MREVVVLEVERHYVLRDIVEAEQPFERWDVESGLPYALFTRDGEVLEATSAPAGV